MRYFGSKTSVLEQLHNLISERVPSGLFCDPFGGIGTVGAYFKSKNYKVYSGDQLVFAHYFQLSKIFLNDSPKFKKLCRYLGTNDLIEIAKVLNNIELSDGWFIENYSIKRNFFTVGNAKKIEACWKKMNFWKEEELLTKNEYALLIASLINSMDKVANTAGTYYAYLKKLYRKAKKEFTFEFLKYTIGNPYCKCFLSSAEVLVKNYKFDVLYLDPPYNERCYNSYYHLPETIAIHDEPEIIGKSGIPTCGIKKSAFNKKTEAINSLKNILNNSQFRLGIFHYSDNGLIPPPDLRNLLRQYGKVEEYILEAIGYTNHSISRSFKHHVYLIIS